MTPDLILAAMLSLPPSALDRADTQEQRADLFRPVAAAIAEVSRNDTEAALLIAQGWEDTKFARYVLEGRCSDGPVGQRCDNGRSRGAFQVGRWCVAIDVAGEARCALRAARGGAHRCRERAITPSHGAFAGLAARDCHWTGAEQRVRTMKRVLRELRRAT